MKRYDKRVLLPIMRWDYGKPERGASCEQTWFLPAFREQVSQVDVLWIDELLDDPQGLAHALQSRIEQFAPDLIFFIPYRNEWSRQAVSELSRHAVTVAWFGDDQWRFDSFSSHLASAFSKVVTTDPLAVMKYRNLGVEAVLSDWAGMAPADKHLWEGARDYEFDVTFVGGATESRKWAVKKLDNSGIKVECFGAGWSNGRVSFEEMDRIFSRSRINLNLSNSIPESFSFLFSSAKALASWIVSKKRYEQVKARNFEIPLAGGFQLTNYVFGLERHFDIGRELAVYSSFQECANVIRYYLNNEDQRRMIERQGCLRAHKDHTYQQRISAVLEHIWS